MKIRSRAQARLFGAVAGKRVRLKKLTPKKAREKLRGIKLKRLPERIGKRKRR